MKLSQPLFWLLILLWFAAGAWWYSSSPCSTCAATVAENNTATIPAVTATAATPSLSVNDSAWMLYNTDNLRFGKSADVPVLSAAISKTIDSLADYAKKPFKKIVVTGYYAASEKNNTGFENLGLARADALKKILIARGVPEASITATASLVNDLYFTPSDTLIGGVGFAFSNVIKTEEALLFEPRTVYFNTAQNSLNVNTELVTYIQNATKYLQANPAKKLMVTGFTDNVGDEQRNIQLSAARAAFVKNQLAKKGVPAAQIETAGKGMGEPVADNATADGRAKNRRVTIALQ